MKTTDELLNEAAEKGRSTPLHELVNGIPEDDKIRGEAREQWLASSGEITRIGYVADKLAIEARAIAYDISRAIDKPIAEARKVLDAIPDRIEAIRAQLAEALK